MGPHPDFQKKWTMDFWIELTLYQNSLFRLKVTFDILKGVHFKHDTSFSKLQPKNT